MKKFKAWVSAARLRTLPLSLAGIISGTALANLEGANDTYIVILCFLVTIGFQITSNFSNDYGDGVKGTDASDRIGPTRAIQSGALTPKALKKGIIIVAVTSILFVLVLLYYAFGWKNLPYFIVFLVLGGLSIWAAIRYTVGDSAYGYRGLGDLFVFLFFGILAVLGTKFLYTKELVWLDILPAIAIGLLCVGVLNLNNLRDIISDTNHGKRTLIVMLGFTNGKRYHFILILLSFVFFLCYCLLKSFEVGQVLMILFPYVFVFIHLIKTIRFTEPIKFDPELKKLALATFALSLFFYLTVNYFL